MQPTQYADIDKLRQAAAVRDVEQSEFLLKKLFHQLEFVRALGLAAEQAYRYAPVFERYHPEEVWARRMLVQIVMTASAPDEAIIQQAFQHFHTPGTANYFKALHDLFQATQKRHASEARIGFLVGAVINAMTAEVVERYFGEQPDRWNAYRAQGADFNEIALAFWTDEAVIAHDRELWNDLADRVLATLTRP